MTAYQISRNCQDYLFFILLIIPGVFFGQTEENESLLEAKLDSIVLEGLDSMAFPGAQLLVAKDGEILLEKAYGYHTYEKNQPVTLEDVYDLASVTKVSTGLPVLMKLLGEGKFDLDAPLQEYLPHLKGSNKGGLKYREILSHQAGLQPYIVFWQKTLKKKGGFKKKTFQNRGSDDYSIRITDDLYLHNSYKKKMFKAIRKSKLNPEKTYKYSGLVFLMMPEIITNITGQDFEYYLYNNFYHSLGAKNLRYKPGLHFRKDQIIPTERDTFFRKTQVHGSVHDEAAAMLNGVSCNAGLFGNANDLSKLFQMYLNKGMLDGKRYISEKAVEEFTRCQYCETGNRRGLGFDKPLIEYDAARSYVAESASPSSFGHSGFTGTFVWADPEHNVLFIFLSNRVYPTRDNRKLYTMNLRPRMHQAIYDVLIK